MTKLTSKSINDFGSLKTDLLDRLLDLDIISDDDGKLRTAHYLMSRRSRFFTNREWFRNNVIEPLEDAGYISPFKNYKYQHWELSYEITDEGRKYLKRTPIEPDRKQYLKDAREILRLILKTGRGQSLEEIVGHLKGRSRIITETLESMLVSFILDFSPSGHYMLSGRAYLVYMEVKESSLVEKADSLSVIDKERLESLLLSIDDEDNDDE